MTPEWEAMLQKYNAYEVEHAAFRQALQDLGRGLASLDEVNELIGRRRQAWEEFEQAFARTQLK